MYAFLIPNEAAVASPETVVLVKSIVTEPASAEPRKAMLASVETEFCAIVTSALPEIERITLHNL
jgi:hypothetical protein